MAVWVKGAGLGQLSGSNILAECILSKLLVQSLYSFICLLLPDSV